jgi:hypothetical protein
VFKFLLTTPEGQPPYPAVFVTAVPNWHAGEQLMVASGGRYRILGINENVDEERLEELYRRGIARIWMVEPVK